MRYLNKNIQVIKKIKQRIRSCSSSRRFNVLKVLILPKLIYSFNKISVEKSNRISCWQLTKLLWSSASMALEIQVWVHLSLGTHQSGLARLAITSEKVYERGKTMPGRKNPERPCSCAYPIRRYHQETALHLQVHST